MNTNLTQKKYKNKMKYSGISETVKANSLIYSQSVPPGKKLLELMPNFHK